MLFKIEVGGKEGWNLELYIPDGVPNSAKLPLMLFNTGNGEIGNAEQDRAEIYRNGPMKFVKEGWKPDFVVGGCQSTGGWAGYPFFLAMLEELTGGGYPVDKEKIGITGLSGGAHACIEYVNKTPKDRYIPIKVMIPMGITPSIPLYPERYNDIHVWGFGGSTDSHMVKLRDFVLKLPNGKFTTYKGGHSGWNNYYTPNYKENDQNIYDWSLSKFGLVVPTPVPVPEPEPVPVREVLTSIIYAAHKRF
jgi:hypothetical protein